MHERGRWHDGYRFVWSSPLLRVLVPALVAIGGLAAIVLAVWRAEFAATGTGDAIAIEPASDFSELGGDSLVAVRIAAELSARLALDADMQAEIVLVLFERGTPEALCAFLGPAIPP